MAVIRVTGEHATVVLSEPDEDGDYDWTCDACSTTADAVRPIDEAIMHAGMHADFGGK